MTERRRQWLEKWGILSAIATVITVALLMGSTLVTIAQWTGKYETRMEHVCQKAEATEKAVKEFPDRYIAKEEYTRRWEMHMKREADERLELRALYDNFDRKLDKMSDKLDELRRGK